LEKVVLSEENSFAALLTYLRKRSKLVLARQGIGWTQKDVAEALGVSERTYKAWERGERIPDQRDLKNIATLFRLDTEDETMLYREAARVPHEIHNFPFNRNPLFTGREALLKQLEQALQANGSVALTQPVSISGLGGIGKTQLALEYAHRCFPNIYRAVLWVNASDEMLEASYGNLSEVLSLPEKDEQELGRHVQAVREWLERHTNWLLIMDNADDLELARSYFPVNQDGRILLTTRSQTVGDVAATQIEVDKMQPDEGLRFLLLRSDPTLRSKVFADETVLDTVAADIREAAAQLVELLDGHPLALDQAGAYIEETKVSFTDYIERYRAERRKLLNRRKAQVSKHTDHPESVVVTFELCFANAHEQYPLASDILNFCAFLQPDAIPEELFQHEDNFKYGTTVFDDCFATLLRYSLIRRNTQDQTFSMHRLVQIVLIDAMSSDLQKQERILVVRTLCLAFFDNLNSSDNLLLNERLLPHILVCATWAYDVLAWTPDVGAIVGLVFNQASNHLHERGQVSEAEFLKERGLVHYDAYLGLEHPATLSTINELAVIYGNQGKHDKAEPLHQYVYGTWIKILKTEKANLNKDLLDQAVKEMTQSLFSLGLNNMRQNNLEQSEQYLREALSIQMNYLGNKHPDTAMSLFWLALLDMMQGKLEQEAEAYTQQAISIWENSEHLDRAYPIIWVAEVVKSLGQYDLVERLYQQALDILERALGARHPEVQATKRLYEDFLRKRRHDVEAAVLELNDEPSV
jgi:transcriptional regulator with XRE-family HTH domain